MRTATFLFAMTLATASIALLPGADASMQACTATSGGCPGFVCIDQNGDRAFSDAECVSKGDIDRCQFQSDCCASTTFWCPETE